MKILTKKAIIAVLISSKIDFKTKALLGMEELLYDKKLSSSRRRNTFKHYTHNETASKIYKAHICTKSRDFHSGRLRDFNTPLSQVDWSNGEKQTARI